MPPENSTNTPESPISWASGRAIHLVAHTHWDREWYLSFEGFRARLIPMLDELLDVMAADDRWAHFHMDGQTAMIDDYLEARPEREPALRKLIGDGRLSCGPWVTLIDEFLVSGESIIRNLEDGMRRAAELGAPDACPFVGYLPDQFGHIGQMPQLLAAAGITKAVVWRGVPSRIEEIGFRWHSPGGAAVDVHYLPFGYGQGRMLETDPDGFLARLTAEESALAPFLSPGEPMLLMVGDDHERVQAGLVDAVQAAHAEGLPVSITSLVRHLDGARPPDLDWTGELRSAARANLLPNTYPVRSHQKVARAQTEHLLERFAEPLAALVPGCQWPLADLQRAWKLLHLNGAHDSVCGCSTDDVAQAVDERTEEARSIGVNITTGALQHLADQMQSPGTLLFNPSPFERDGVPALGWSMTNASPPPDHVDLTVQGNAVVCGEIRLRFEDTADAGDLYNFCPSSAAEFVTARSDSGGIARLSNERVAISVSAQMRRREPFVSFTVDLDNRSGDHRVRVLLDLPRDAPETIAGAPFEFVHRPVHGEGGAGEVASPWWPARGVVTAGGSGFLAEGVFEYELIPPRTLALTLLRATGTISRPHAISTRRGPAGPDVPTPAAQSIGRTSRRFGVFLSEPGPTPIETWECFALELLTAQAPGGGSLPLEGSLLDLQGVPALSSIIRSDGGVAVRVWNPHAEEVVCRVRERSLTLAPHAISRMDVPLG